MNAAVETGTSHSTGQLEAVLRRGHFAVTAETSPPDAADAAVVLDRVAPLKGVADAVNVTDGAGARAHMSAIACAAILARDGYQPVLQFTARDRNRLALQGDLVGAGALGIHNILCLYGDDPKSGDQPDAKAVFDLDTTGILSTAKGLREGAYPGGRAVSPAPTSSRPSIASTWTCCAPTWRGLATRALPNRRFSSSVLVPSPRPSRPAI